MQIVPSLAMFIAFIEEVREAFFHMYVKIHYENFGKWFYCFPMPLFFICICSSSSHDGEATTVAFRFILLCYACLETLHYQKAGNI